MFIKVNPTRDRRRGGISFSAQQAQVIDCDKLKVSEEQAKAILDDPVLRAVECDGDGATTGEERAGQQSDAPEASAEVRTKRLAVLVEMASEKPSIAMVAEALGFDVSADELDAAWDAKAGGDDGGQANADALRTHLAALHKADASKKPTVVTVSAELGFAVTGAEITAIWADLSK
ncbi:MAG: hypothetical protein AAFO61_11900 [Pseudomonadota bacterium]